MRPSPRSSTLVLGLMSGTSGDGIDVALVRIAGDDTAVQLGSDRGAAKARLENFATLPFPRDVRAAMLRVAEGDKLTAGELS